ncbi:hypothetical protein LINPERHAP2_LOCUS31858, partial [Linum perenne]
LYIKLTFLLFSVDEEPFFLPFNFAIIFLNFPSIFFSSLSSSSLTL